MVGWRRVLAAFGVAAAAVLLAGCDTAGRIEVVSVDEVSVDLTFTDVDPVGCTQIENSTMHLSAVASTDSSGRNTCRVQGAVELAALTGVRVTSAGDYEVLSGTLGQRGSEAGELDLTVVMPGAVVASSHGTTSGDAVHFVGPLASLLGESFVVVSSQRQEPPWPLVGLIGFSAGVVVVLGWLRLRRGGRPSPASLPLEADEPGGAPAREGDPEPTTEHATELGPVAEPGTLEADHSWLAVPPADLTPTRPGPEPAPFEERPDHSVWAPPEERHDRGPID